MAFSCTGRGVCPSCNGRHMAQTAAHLADHVIPPVPVRQWVISVPKRLRCFLANRPEAVAALTKIFLAEIGRLLSAAGDVTIDAVARPRLGALSFVHRFGSALNRHVHVHVCAADGVFVPAAGRAGCFAPPVFLPARPITQADLATVTERVRCRVIRFLQARSPAQRFCGSRHARLGEQRVFHRRFSCGSRSSSATCRATSRAWNTCCGTVPGPLCIGATVRDPRPSRPHRPSPLRAPAAQGGQLGRAGSWAEVHAAGS